MNEVLKLRLAMKLDQDDFSAVLGVTQSCIAHWEAYTRAPRRKHLRKMKELAQNEGIEFDLNKFMV